MMGVIVDNIYKVIGLTSSLNGMTIEVDGFKMSLPPVTLAASTLSVVSFPIALFPSTWFRKLIALAGAVTVITLLNLFRIVLLGILGAHSPRMFDLVHQYLFQFVFLAAIFIIFELSIRWMDLPKDSHSDIDAIKTGNEQFSSVSFSWLAALKLIAFWTIVVFVLNFCMGTIARASSESNWAIVSYTLLVPVVNSWLIIWMLGSFTFLSAASIQNEVPKLRDVCNRSAQQIGNLLRAATYCSIWIWRPPVAAASVLVTSTLPKLQSRQSYLIGNKLMDENRVAFYAIVIACAVIIQLFVMRGPFIDSVWFSVGIGMIAIMISVSWIWMTQQACKRLYSRDAKPRGNEELDSVSTTA